MINRTRDALYIEIFTECICYMLNISEMLPSWCVLEIDLPAKAVLQAQVQNEESILGWLSVIIASQHSFFYRWTSCWGAELLSDWISDIELLIKTTPPLLPLSPVTKYDLSF